jgi:branched-chain amino acid transport system ATP-binding protein
MRRRGARLGPCTSPARRAAHRHSSRGTTIIVVEHNVRAVLGLCARSMVLNYGEKLVEGTPRECVADPAVIEAYLGTDSDVV